MIFKKKKNVIGHKTRVFICSAISVWHISHCNWAIYNHKHAVSRVKSYVNKTWVIPKDFRKILKHHIVWKSVQWESLSYAYGQTDATRLSSFFSQFFESAYKTWIEATEQDSKKMLSISNCKRKTIDRQVWGLLRHRRRRRRRRRRRGRRRRRRRGRRKRKGEGREEEEKGGGGEEEKAGWGGGEEEDHGHGFCPWPYFSFLVLLSPLHKPLFRSLDEKFCSPYNGVKTVCFSYNRIVPVRKCVFNEISCVLW